MMAKQTKINQTASEPAPVTTRDNLRGFMKGYGYTQADIARMLGVSRTMICLFLNNKYPGDLQNLAGSISDLISDDLRSRLSGLQILDGRIKAAIEILGKAVKEYDQIGEWNGTKSG